MRHLIGKILEWPFLILSSFSQWYTNFISAFEPSFAPRYRKHLLLLVNQSKQQISHINSLGNEFKASIFTPNPTCAFRASSFEWKEPLTLRWIDTLGGEASLIDVGANIGLYSIYYSKTKKCTSYAIEPGPDNVKELVRNVAANKLEHLITVFPFPLSEQPGVSEYLQSSDEIGGAQSMFGLNHGLDGNLISPALRWFTLGLSLDLLYNMGFLAPTVFLLKIDVDGIEHRILDGATELLSSGCVRSVLVEVQGDYIQQRTRIEEQMLSLDFCYDEELSGQVWNSRNRSGSWNQVWIKKSEVKLFR